MTDRNKVLPENDRVEEGFFSTVQLLNEGLRKLDGIENVQQDEQWFEHFVLNEKQKIRTRFKKELAWFILCALLILSGVMFTLMEIPQLFFVLQAAAVVVTVLYSFKYAAKQVDGL